jgi:hypothetical protein
VKGEQVPAPRVFPRVSVYFSRCARTRRTGRRPRWRDREALRLRGTLRGKWRSPLLITARLRLRVPAYWLFSGPIGGDVTAQLDMVTRRSAGLARAWRMCGRAVSANIHFFRSRHE